MTLRLRITIASLLTVLLVSAGLLKASAMMSNSWFDRYESTIMHSHQALFNSIVESQQDAMETELSALTRDRKVRNLMAKNDIDGLKVEAAPAFRRLSASNIISKEQLTNNNGDIIFSLPEQRLGKSEKILINQVLKEGKVLRGIELDSDKLVIELAFPLFQRGKVIGVGVFMKDMNSTLAKFKHIHGSEVSIIDAAGLIDSSTNSELHHKLIPISPDSAGSSYRELTLEDKFYGVTTTPILNPLGKALGYLVDIQDQTEVITATSTIKKISYLSSTVMLILVGLFFAWYMHRSFRPLVKAINAMECIAEGDLSIKIQSNSNDEVGGMLRGMGGMVAHLNEIISRLITMTNQLKNASTNLKQTAEESSVGIQVQMHETEQVATAITEMNVTAKNVAKSAAEMATEAEKVNSDTQKSKAIVSTAIEAIHSLDQKIQNSSKSIRNLQEETGKIGSVLDVIKGIAEQTNLLALNAAIEAARAGDQGRGFAVVADEVRTLAGRTQKSTTDINEMIKRLQNGANDTVKLMEESLDQVQYSVDTIVQSGAALDTISGSISSITNMNIMIASAAEEQCSVAEEINKNVVKISMVTEDSVTRIAQSAKASDELNQLTDELGQLSSRFKI